MNSSMVICAGDMGVGAEGVTVAVEDAGVGCGDTVESLTVLAPCGFDSIRGNNDVPLWMVVPGTRRPHSTPGSRIGELKSAERPSWWLMVCALTGMNE